MCALPFLAISKVFSSFSEQLSPIQLVNILNEYLSAMTDILLKQKGTLDKYEGDALVAFFGAPLPLENHPVYACKTALFMQEKLIELRKKWSQEKYWPNEILHMQVRIGINTGEMVIGNMGSSTRMNYTMMGDSVNLAARLEQSAKQYGILIHVAKQTVEQTQKLFLWRDLGPIYVVGKKEPVTSFELLCELKNAPPELIELNNTHQQGLELYLQQKFKEAMEIFKSNQEKELKRFSSFAPPDNPSQVFIKRCQYYLQHPPPSRWNGAWALGSK